jgi:hypothetical protein
MKAEKIEDAHNFKRNLNIDAGLGKFTAEKVHEQYQSFINDNYVLKQTEVTNEDYIKNRP